MPLMNSGFPLTGVKLKGKGNGTFLQPFVWRNDISTVQGKKIMDWGTKSSSLPLIELI